MAFIELTSYTLISLLSLFLILGYFMNIHLNKIQLKFFNILLIVLIAIFSYSFTPPINYDLLRYYDMLDAIKGVSWDKLQAGRYGPYPETILTNYYFYLISNYGNYSLFSAIPTTLIFLGIIFIYRKLYEKVPFTNKIYYLYLLSFLSVAGILGIISGVRQPFAWIVLLLALYFDFFTEKKKSFVIVLYIIPILIHQSVATLIIIRIIMLFTNKIKHFGVLFIIWPSLLFIIPFIYNLVPTYIQSLINSLELYSGSRFSFVTLFTLTLYILIILMIFGLTNFRKNFFLISEHFFNYYCAVVFFGISSIFAPTLFSRTLTFVIYMSLPILIEYSYQKINNKKIILDFLLLIIILLYILNNLILSPYITLF